jgi:hypothetical protein
MAQTTTMARDAAYRASFRTQPLQRLEAFAADAALERELGPLRQQDEAALGKWIAEGSIGTRPPSSATTLLENRLAELAPDRGAVGASIPAAQAAHMAAIERVARQRQGAMQRWPRCSAGRWLP